MNHIYIITTISKLSFICFHNRKWHCVRDICCVVYPLCLTMSNDSSKDSPWVTPAPVKLTLHSLRKSCEHAYVSVSCRKSYQRLQLQIVCCQVYEHRAIQHSNNVSGRISAGIAL